MRPKTPRMMSSPLRAVSAVRLRATAACINSTSPFASCLACATDSACSDRSRRRLRSFRRRCLGPSHIDLSNAPQSAGRTAPMRIERMDKWRESCRGIESSWFMRASENLRVMPLTSESAHAAAKEERWEMRRRTPTSIVGPFCEKLADAERPERLERRLAIAPESEKAPKPSHASPRTVPLSLWRTARTFTPASAPPMMYCSFARLSGVSRREQAHLSCDPAAERRTWILAMVDAERARNVESERGESSSPKCSLTLAQERAEKVRLIMTARSPMPCPLLWCSICPDTSRWSFRERWVENRSASIDDLSCAPPVPSSSPR
mmetsp:Transcript_11342/g.27527  ORF Transcript_11342/g.27527 Transcript_11342/m.27527 type:complete len:321 (-) Transcript_11342:469-1431(-)